MSTALDRIVRGLVATGSGLNTKFVIPGNDKGQRPSVTYASVLPMPDTRLGYPQNDPISTGVRTTTWRVRNYSVQWYRDDAYDTALRFEAWSSADPGLDALEVENVRFVRPFYIQRLDNIVSDHYEERAVMTLGVKYVDVRDFETSLLEGVTTTICVSGVVDFDEVTVEHG